MREKRATSPLTDLATRRHEASVHAILHVAGKFQHRKEPLTFVKYWKNRRRENGKYFITYHRAFAMLEFSSFFLCTNVSVFQVLIFARKLSTKIVGSFRQKKSSSFLGVVRLRPKILTVI
jgi:hypothetical protein